MTLRLNARTAAALSASVVLCVLVGWPVMTRLSAAGPIAVNSTSMMVSPSDGLCTLPEAINSANGDVASGSAAGECRAGVFGFDAIALPAGTFTAHVAHTTMPAAVGLALPVVTSPIEIVGDSPAATIIERSSAAGVPEFRVFYVRSTGSVILRRVTVRNGKIGAAGGAIYIENTSQTSNAIIDSVLSDNESTWGGAIYAGAPLLTIRNSAIERNRARAGGSGVGAIFVTGRLVIERSRFESNRSEAFAGAASVGFLGSLDVADSVFIRNSAKVSGGALETSGATLTITRSWLHANRAEASGGAIGAERMDMSYTTVTDNVAVTGGGGGASVTGANGWTLVSDSTFTGNVAGETGGGIVGVAMAMTDTTVSGNQAKNGGGGIAIYGTQRTYLKANNVTVTNNVVTAAAGVGGGVLFGAAPTTLSNSIVAGNVVGANQSAPDCSGSITAQSLGHNIIGNSCGCSLAALASDRVGTWNAPIDPRLGALQDNGGPTLTHLPLAGSLALDSASPLVPGSDPEACGVRDQRGVERPQDGNADGVAISDRGAAEFAGDPFPTRPSFSVATYFVDEPGGSIDITVNRADGTGEIEMLYSATPGAAAAGTDFLATSGSLTFLDGETTKTFSVSVIDDAVNEGTESIRLSLRAPGAAADSLPVSSAILFVADDDAFPLIWTEDGATDEGNAGTRDVHLTVRLHRAYTSDVSVAYSTENGTATAGQDYDAASGVVTIGGGTTSKSLVVRVRGDLVDEPDEHFRVRLMTTIGCASEIEYATITIRDDDESNRAPDLTNPGPQTAAEGSSPSRALLATDPDGDALTYAASGLPPGLSIDGTTGVMTGSLGYAAAGAYTVIATATDPDGAVDTVTFVWTVTNTNRPPTLTALADQTHVEGDAASLQAIGSDLDDDALVYAASGLPPGISIDSATGAIGGTLAPASQGSYAVTITVADAESRATASFGWIVTPRNRNPVCDDAQPTLDVIWPPNHKRTHTVGVQGVTDSDGDAISITITAIWQDEPTNTVGDGNTSVDGYGVGTSQAEVRAERSGTPKVPGDGRLYEIFFTASDGAGGTCTGSVHVGVPHDMGQHRSVVDSLVRYDSTTGTRIR